MGFLTREQILEADDLKTEIVPVPEWKTGENDSVIVRTMMGTDRDAFDQELLTEEGKSNLENFRAKLCAYTIVDEEGERLFSQEDIIKLGKKSSLALNRVFIVAQKLNGLAPGDVEEMAKNSETTPENSSGSS